MKIVVVSGGFDPIHSGHIDYIKSAKKLGDKVVVALNSDEWLKRKKGSFFMPFHERKAILEQLSSVNQVIDFVDDDIGSAINALKKITSEIEKPVSLIIGGSKISTKIKIINNLIKKFNNIIIVGGMCNTMLKHTGSNIGKSICENECGSLIKEIL